MKLGRKAVKTDSRTLRLAKYMTPGLPPAPIAADWTKGITEWGMMLNDTLGCCTIAGIGHAIQIWTANTSGEVTVPDSTILSYYESFDGYVDGNPSTDQGGIELDVLTQWKAKGFAGNTLTAFADPAVSHLDEVKQAINLFGGVYIGFNVPQSVMDTASNPEVVWDVNGDNTIIGGHCVFVPKYDENGLTCISWGQLYTMTPAFWSKFVDEAHALLSPDWISTCSPNGFDLAQLQTDLSLIS